MKNCSLFPEEIRNRKKSPYPQPVDPNTTIVATAHIKKILEDPTAPLWKIYDPTKLAKYVDTQPEVSKMQSHQYILTTLISLNIWLTHYNINIVA